MKLSGLKSRPAVIAAIRRELPNCPKMNLIKTNYCAVNSIDDISNWCAEWTANINSTPGVSRDDAFIDLFRSGATGVIIAKENGTNIFCPVVDKEYKNNDKSQGLADSSVASNISLVRLSISKNKLSIQDIGPFPYVKSEIMVGWQVDWPQVPSEHPPLSDREMKRKELMGEIVVSDYLISGENVRNVIRSGLPKGSQTQILIDDKTYTTVRESLFRKFLDFDNTDQLTYIPESRDCDDFARIVCNNAKDIGIGAVGFDRDAPSGHEYSIAVLVKDSFTGKVPEYGDLESFFFEPQIATPHTRIIPGHGHYMDMRALIIV